MSSASATAYVDPTAGAVEFCESLAREHPQLQELCSGLTECLQRKLWHQLTISVLDTFERKADVDAQIMLGIFDKVLMSVDSKLDALRLAQIASSVATALSQTDMVAAKAVLENLAVRYADKEDDENHDYSSARLYLQSKLFCLQLLPLQGSASINQEDNLLASIKKGLKQNAATLQTTDNSIAAVHAAHYEASMTYYKLVGPPERFVMETLSFLNYRATTKSIANFSEDVALAVDLCVAALVGENFYNLTQIQQTSIVHSLSETPQLGWVFELLDSCADGNVLTFQSLLKKYSSEIASQPALVNGAGVVQEKLTLMALVHLVFDKPSNQRTLGFDEIAARLHVPLDQVEWIVMRALSVHLIEGSMDQVDQTLQVTWVMPRVLNAPQMKALAERFGAWAEKVNSTKDFMQTTVEAAF